MIFQLSNNYKRLTFIKVFNNTPAETKDGSSQSVQAVTQTQTNKSAEKNEDSSVEKLLGALSSFGGVRAEAANACYNDSAWVQQWKWTGAVIRGNSCYARKFKESALILTAGSLVVFMLVGAACAIVSIAAAGIGGFVCYILFSTIAAKAFAMYQAGIEWENKTYQCNGWASVEINYWISYKTSYC